MSAVSTRPTAPGPASAPAASPSAASGDCAARDTAAPAPAASHATATATDTAPSVSVSARRDAEATRAAIQKAARYLLARHAHNEVTLKAIADRAGVSPPLILKYFGNKDALVARVMSFDTDADALLDAPLAELGRHMVRHVLLSQRERGADPLLRIAFAPLHGEHGDVLRVNFRTQVVERLAGRLAGPDAGLRAELAVATLVGLGVMYGVARGVHVREGAIEDMVDRYAPGVQTHLTP